MSIINNALSGALAAQVALTAASQNIANLQTRGYTRQGVLLGAMGPDQSPHSTGSGVQVTALLRFSDNYKSQAMWRAASDQGQYSQNQPYLTQLENVMGDKDASLSSGIDEFFKALNAVAGDPGSTPLRQAVVTSANLMAERFNGLNNVFNSQLQSVRQQRSAVVDAANAQISTIASLNAQIVEARSAGVSPSALIDARDQAIDELASKMGVEVSDNADGTRDVSLKSGQALVLGGMHGSLKAAPTATSPQEFSLSFAGTTYVLDANKMGGQLGGLSKYETEKLLPLQKDVDDMARQVAERVNTQLGLGFKADGPPGTPGTPLFVYTPGSSTDMLKLVPGFKAEDLAFSSDGTPGDTGNLQKLVAIKGQAITLTSLGTVVLSDADTQLVGKLGVDSKLNKEALKTAQAVRTHSVDSWQATSGVNQDEEAVNLAEFEKMYNANMQVVRVATQLFDTLLASMN
ncbi:flagellar hook-associated protein FlgK [Massilia niastensis]|uniref:flagellar hook-associated protein FlgK n=1 Tax=Massilia niastensis TaxID=544911 RepID=UPI000379237D|nr:flagellar hook-associated protein FlgK [Massilia niastensis]